MEPKEFLKKLHPDQFSDSKIKENVTCSRELLDFHLSKLSEKNKHFDFEDFIRRLLEREVCPNLIEETGPAGGGDGKVDTENYPVAENLQEFWLNGLNKENERWAFAISLKTDWKTKCDGDIKKIINTQRGYTKIFFITNQSIKNDIREKYQDNKRQETGIEIIVLDKTWILDRALKVENVSLLKIIGIGQVLKEKKLGENDYKRQLRIEEIDEKLKKYATSGTVNQEVIDLAIETAMLSIEMEDSEDIVNTKFQRALRFAKKKSNVVAERKILYEIAWYSHWRINDKEQFEEHYSKYEEEVIKDKKIEEIEKLVNLWTLFYTTNNGDADKVKDRTEKLLKLLEEKLNSKSRVTYLKARTKICIMKITLQQDVDEQFKIIKEIINEAIKFKEYDFVQLAKMIEVLLPIYNSNKYYNELYELITENLKERKGEVQKAEMYLKKSKILSKEEQHYEAIKVLGKCLNLLYKEESNGKLAEAYVNIGANYEAIGLKYAAKNYYIAAVAMFIDIFLKEDYLDSFSLKILKELMNIEIEQGNVENAIEWIEISNILTAVLIDKNIEIDIKGEEEFFLKIDAIISMMILKTKKYNFKDMERIIAKCRRVYLTMSEVMAKYVIGLYDKDILKECNNDSKAVDAIIKETYEASHNQNLTEPKYIDNNETCIESFLMGFRIKIYINGSKLSYRFGEYIMSLVEDTFATMYSYKTIMRNDIIIVLNEGKGEFDFDYSFDGIETYTIKLNGLNINDISIQQQKEISNNLYKLLANILAVNFIYDNFEETIKALFENEKSFERAINHTSSLYTLNKIFGSEEEYEIEHLDIKRDNEWYKNVVLEKEKSKEESTNISISDKEVIYEKPEDISWKNVSHSKIYTSNMIKCAHWDLAKWKAVLFVTDPENKYFGKIGFAFENIDGAKLVFEDLISYATKDDKEGKIIVSFIKCINQNRKYDYRVMITDKIEIPNGREYQIIIPMARFHNMNCENNINLSRIENLLKNNPNANLSIFPAVIKSNTVEPLWEYEIKMKSISIKDAYTISKNDVESRVIMKDDNPFISSESDNSPIKELLELKKKFE